MPELPLRWRILGPFIRAFIFHDWYLYYRARGCARWEAREKAWRCLR